MTREQIIHSIMTVGARASIGWLLAEMPLSKLERLAEKYRTPADVADECAAYALVASGGHVAASRTETVEALYTAFEDHKIFAAFLDDLSASTLRKIAAAIVPFTHAEQILDYCAVQYCCGRRCTVDEARSLALRVRGDRRIGAIQLLDEMSVYRG